MLDRFFLVPAGCKEYFAQKVKLELAEQLQEHYPEGFMLELSHFAECYTNDEAEPILSHLQKRLWGKFQADELQLFGALAERAYRRRNLLPQTYEQYRSCLLYTSRRRFLPADRLDRPSKPLAAKYPVAAGRGESCLCPPVLPGHGHARRARLRHRCLLYTSRCV